QKGQHDQTLLSHATYAASASARGSQPTLTAGGQRPPRKRQRKIRLAEPCPTLPFEPSSHGLLASNRSTGAICPRPARDASKWWSQTGSNRRHPACKAGALPAELWPQQTCSLHRTSIARTPAIVRRPVGGPGDVIAAAL